MNRLFFASVVLFCGAVWFFAVIGVLYFMQWLITP